MWHNCFSRCSRPIGMKKLSYKNRCKVACHAHELTLFTGHKQRFIHIHVTCSPPIGIAKLSEVFMNLFLSRVGSEKNRWLTTQRLSTTSSFQNYYSQWDLHKPPLMEKKLWCDLNPSQGDESIHFWVNLYTWNLRGHSTLFVSTSTSMVGPRVDFTKS